MITFKHTFLLSLFLSPFFIKAMNNSFIDLSDQNDEDTLSEEIITHKKPVKPLINNKKRKQISQKIVSQKKPPLRLSKAQQSIPVKFRDVKKKKTSFTPPLYKKFIIFNTLQKPIYSEGFWMLPDGVSGVLEQDTENVEKQYDMIAHYCNQKATQKELSLQQHKDNLPEKNEVYKRINTPLNSERFTYPFEQNIQNMIQGIAYNSRSDVGFCLPYTPLNHINN